jgi:hypothetical protein
VEIFRVAQRVAEILVLVQARVAEPRESHRNRDVILHEHLLRSRVGGEAHARPTRAQARRQVLLPEVDRLAHVAVGVDHDVVRAAKEAGGHRGSSLPTA